MKLTNLLLFLTFFNLVGTESYSQYTRLNLDMKDVPIQTVLSAIEDQSEFFFLYSSKMIDVSQKVDIHAEAKNISEVLDNLLAKTDIKYTVKDRQILLVNGETELEITLQQNRVTGTVKDENGVPLAGVTILVKGTANGTVTDASGKYTLVNIPQDATLAFSFIGMTPQEIPVNSRAQIDIVMGQEAIGLDEVVVVGYGTQKKVNLTGSVSTIKIDDKIVNRVLPNISSGMSGLVAGLAVSQNSGMAGKNDVSLLIRGMGTVNDARPLVVVDGMPDVDINRIDMHDVESISVLKDASSSAIYGSRAANGVILITTKTGKGQDKTSITASSSYTREVPTKAYEFMADYPRALTLHQRAVAVNTLKSNWLFKDGTIDQWMALGMIDPLRYPNTDWWDIIMRDGTVNNNNLTISSGNERSNFFVSLGRMDQQGLQINNDYKRYNTRFNFDYKIREKMNMGFKFDGNWSKFIYAYEDGFTYNASGGLDLYAAIAGITPYDPVTGYYGGVMAYNENTQAFNPLTYYTNNLNRQNRQEANTGFYADWSPIKGLTGRFEYTLRYYNQFRYTAAIPNRAYNFQTNSFGSRVYVGDNAGVGNYTNTGYKTQLTGQINYQTTIADNHAVKAMLVYSEEYWNDRYQASSRNDRLHPSLHEIDAALTDIQSTGGNSSTEGLRSYIGRLNYTAYEKYLFEANFRYDGSSKFLAGSKYGFFPSASLGWRFSEEAFMKSLSGNWLSNGKLRVSYGGLGNNSGVSRYQQQETLEASPYMIGGVIVKGFVNSKMVNQALSWESTYVLNFGMDLGFLKNRLTSEIDYYDRLTTGMNRPSEMSILLQGAYDAPRKNIGDLRNRGIEGNFTWRDQAGNFNYSFNFNASYNRTILEKWNEFLGRGNVFLNMPYEFVYSYEDLGIAQTWQDVYNATPQGAQPGDILRKDLNGDGRIDGNDLKAYPNSQRRRPTTNYAINGSASWKGIDLTILCQGAAGRKDFWLNNYNNVNFATQEYASRWEHWNNPWSVENRDGLWPRLGGNSNRTETTFWLDDLSYFRLKNIQLGYTLIGNWLRKVKIDNIRIYGSAENLATITRFRGLDPEKVTYENEVYPLNRSFSFGIVIGI